MADQQTFAINAYCKINLHLHVCERRDDGFHDIESVFQLVSVYDRLSVSIGGIQGSCKVVSPDMPLPPVNTITRAVDSFRKASGFSGGVTVTVEKKIPAGAGLGGGSSDAAAVLAALDRLTGSGVGLQGLRQLSAEIGSDVPFFLSSPAALVSGRGENIRPIRARSDVCGVLVWPAIECSTPRAFALLDNFGMRDATVSFDNLERAYYAPVHEWPYYNSFTVPVSAEYPVIGKLLEEIGNCGAQYTAMSGSGSACYGLFSDPDRADCAFRSLSAHWKWCEKFVLLAH